MKYGPNLTFISAWIRQRPIHAATDDIVALIAGLLMPFSFAPFGFYGLTVVALAFLFQVITKATLMRALWRGWIFGLAMFGVGVFWVHESFKFAAVPLPLALLLTGGLVAMLAVYPALFGFLVAFLSGRFPVTRKSPLSIFSLKYRKNKNPEKIGARLKPPPLSALAPNANMPSTPTSSSTSPSVWRFLLVLPAGWILQEWVRGWFLSGFPWLQVGYAHIDSPLAGLAPLLGVYGVGWAAAISAGLLLLVFHIIKSEKSAIGKRVVGLSVLLVLGGGIWTGSAWLAQKTWTTPVGTPIRIALIQGNVPQDKKWLAAQRQPTLDRYFSLTRQQIEPDLVVWPETALPGFYHHFPDFIAGLRQLAHTHPMNILLGVATRGSEPKQYFNSVVAITDAGEAFYHKRHLVPFGEYLPMADILQKVLDFLMIPMSDFSTGPATQAPLRIAEQLIGVSVCYEASFGRDIIGALPQATLLVNVSNDAWFGDSLGPHQNLQMARMRARESGRYLLRATNTGISALMDPRGRIMERAPQFRTSVLTGTVTGMDGATFYVRYGNQVVVSVILVILIIGVFLTRHNRNRANEATARTFDA
uniref:Apolipoprotein N-acyltransferase n=1 Tax=Candidatus Kentrum sp. TUN TaxID=2126343 RepID=A0A450ZJD4_9GAMM|nr:MAG: apolipoprotein N-acyltransferase [Candidatus Kentron sp. TUN]VFK55753.1 MAG: apolipoprotein N-acyltransferase [Candidatus Kentron sp. TUN]